MVQINTRCTRGASSQQKQCRNQEHMLPCTGMETSLGLKLCSNPYETGLVCEVWASQHRTCGQEELCAMPLLDGRILCILYFASVGWLRGAISCSCIAHDYI